MWMEFIDIWSRRECIEYLRTVFLKNLPNYVIEINGDVDFGVNYVNVPFKIWHQAVGTITTGTATFMPYYCTIKSRVYGKPDIQEQTIEKPYANYMYNLLKQHNQRGKQSPSAVEYFNAYNDYCELIAMSKEDQIVREYQNSILTDIGDEK